MIIRLKVFIFQNVQFFLYILECIPKIILNLAISLFFLFYFTSFLFWTDFRCRVTGWFYFYIYIHVNIYIFHKLMFSKSKEFKKYEKRKELYWFDIWSDISIIQTAFVSHTYTNVFIFCLFCCCCCFLYKFYFSFVIIGIYFFLQI